MNIREMCTVIYDYFFVGQLSIGQSRVGKLGISVVQSDTSTKIYLITSVSSAVIIIRPMPHVHISFVTGAM
jgi:hypothetical protein